MIKIAIADDHAVVRRGLKFILMQEFPDAIVEEAQDTLELLRYVREHDPDVVILDIGLPDRSGLDALKDIRYEHPHLPVLVLSMHAEDQYAMRVLKAGAAGYLTKKSAPEELVKAVRKVLSGGQYVSPTLAEKLALVLKGKGDPALPSHSSLSDREYQVLCLIALGKTVTEIADELSLSVKTVSTYRTRILEKMGMKTNAELTRYAIENQLIE